MISRDNRLGIEPSQHLMTPKLFSMVHSSLLSCRSRGLDARSTRARAIESGVLIENYSIPMMDVVRMS